MSKLLIDITMNAKYPWIRQNKTDCGLACLTSIVCYLGYKVSLRDVYNTLGINEDLTELISVGDLTTYAETLGFIAKPIKYKAIDDPIAFDLFLEYPQILHFFGQHWVVVYEKDKENNKYIIADPAQGIVRLTYESMLEFWTTKIILLLHPPSYDRECGSQLLKNCDL